VKGPADVAIAGAGATGLALALMQAATVSGVLLDPRT